MNRRQIIRFLSRVSTSSNLIQKLKIKYRPLVCPLDDLILYAKDKKYAFDIGCGAGQFLALLIEFADVKRVHGIEIEQRLVDEANNLLGQISKANKYKFETYDGKNLPLSIGKADIVYMIDVFHHMPKKTQEQIIKQLFKIMKPGAEFVFKDIDAGSPLLLFNKIHDRIFSGEFGKEIPFVKAKKLCRTAGFEIIESRKKNTNVYPHFFVICKKPER